MDGDQSAVRFLETDYIYRFTKPWSGGSGSAQTLPMTEEAKAAVVKRPIGFTAEFPKKRRRKT